MPEFDFAASSKICMHLEVAMHIGDLDWHAHADVVERLTNREIKSYFGSFSSNQGVFQVTFNDDIEDRSWTIYRDKRTDWIVVEEDMPGPHDYWTGPY